MTTLAAAEPGQVIARCPLRTWDYLTLNAYFFALSFLWNSMGPILLPSLVLLFVPASQKGSALTLISALGLVVATIVQPVSGAWSDTHTTRWGRRRPYIVAGTLFDVIFLSAMAFAGNYWILLVAYLFLQVSSNVAHGPYQGYIPELVPEAKRGAVTGAKQFLEILGIIATSLVVGGLIGRGQIVAAFMVIIAFLLFTMVITALFVTERPFAGASGAQPRPADPNAKQALSIRIMVQALLRNRDFFLWLVSRLLILMGGNLIRNYALFFFQDVLGIENPAAQVGSLLAVIAVAIAAVAYPAGVLSDRWGRKPLTVVSGMLGALGALMLLGVGNVNQALVVGGILGVSIGIFLSVNWAWATDLIPADEGGLYFGISNLATAGSGVLAGIGGFMLDHFNAQAHNLGYTALYLSAAICYGLGTIIVLRVSDRKQTKKEEST